MCKWQTSETVNKTKEKWKIQFKRDRKKQLNKSSINLFKILDETTVDYANLKWQFVAAADDNKVKFYYSTTPTSMYYNNINRIKTK